MIPGGTLRPPPRRSRRRPATARRAFVAAHGVAIKPSRPSRPAKRYTLPATTRSDAASGGRNQIARANRYKKTRQYYRDYQAGFQANPKVRAANRVIDRAERARTPAQRARVTRAKRTYATELRRGPDKVSQAIYRNYARRLWKRAGKYYPEPTDRPRTVVDYDTPKHILARVFGGPKQNVVHVSPIIPREFMNPRRYRPHSESVLLHEWAHTRQPLPEPKSLAEGDAEAVERLLARRLGLRYEKSRDYEPWRRQARKRGKRYVLKEQYQR